MNPFSIKKRLVTVFCGSSSRVDGHYLEGARLVGRVLCHNVLGVVYGGGRVGMMGALADEVLAMGGEIRGVIPRFMIEREWAHPEVQTMDIVSTMTERKTRMIELGDLVLALPGGLGTLDEFFEAATLRQLGCLNSPLLLFNHHGYFDHLLKLREHFRDQAFLADFSEADWQIINDVGALQNFIEKWLSEQALSEVNHASG